MYHLDKSNFGPSDCCLISYPKKWISRWWQGYHRVDPTSIVLIDPCSIYNQYLPQFWLLLVIILHFGLWCCFWGRVEFHELFTSCKSLSIRMLWYPPNIATHRQILSIRVGYYELGCCVNSIHSKLWSIALDFGLFCSIIGTMVGCRWGCYGRMKRPPSYRGIVPYQYSRQMQRKLVLVVCYCLLMASYRPDRLPSNRRHGGWKQQSRSF